MDSLYHTNGNNPLQPGDMDVYVGSDLRGCEGFPVTGYNVPLMELTFTGDTRTWIPSFVRVFFDDGAYVECPVNEEMGENSQVQVHCNLQFPPC